MSDEFEFEALRDDDDEDAERRQEKRREVLAQELEDELWALRQVLDTHHGRAVIFRLLTECKVFDPLSVGSKVDMASDIVLSNFGKNLRRQVLTAGNSYYTMMEKEANDRVQQREARLEDA